MPDITFAEAKEFLENINEKDTIAVIHHDDGDGFCSGVIYYDWCKLKGASVREFTYNIGKSHISDFDIKDCNKLIVVDLASGFMAEEIFPIENKEIFYTDHHPKEGEFNDNVKCLITTDVGYIPSSRTAGELTGLKPFLALTGTITDSGHFYEENDKFIKSKLENLGMNLDEFKEKVSSVVSNFLYYFYKDYSKAFELLDNINSIEDIKKIEKYSEEVEMEIQKFIKEYDDKKEKLGDINFYYLEPHFPIKGVVVAIISHDDTEGIYIFAAPKSSDKNKISLSARSQCNKMNMSDLLKVGVRGLEESNAGGHARAAGGMILAKDLENFKNNIRNFMNSRND